MAFLLPFLETWGNLKEKIFSHVTHRRDGSLEPSSLRNANLIATNPAHLVNRPSSFKSHPCPIHPNDTSIDAGWQTIKKSYRSLKCACVRRRPVEEHMLLVPCVWVMMLGRNGRVEETSCQPGGRASSHLATAYHVIYPRRLYLTFSIGRTRVPLQNSSCYQPTNHRQT